MIPDQKKSTSIHKVQTYLWGQKADQQVGREV